MITKNILLVALPLIAFFTGCGSKAKDEVAESTVVREKPLPMGYEFTLEIDNGEPEDSNTKPPNGSNGTSRGSGRPSMSNSYLDWRLQGAAKELKARLLRSNLRSFKVEPKGNDRIVVQIPALQRAKHEEVKRNIQRPSLFQFHLVHEESDELAGLEMEGHTNLIHSFKDRQGKMQTETVLIETKVRMDGRHVSHAVPSAIPLPPHHKLPPSAPLINFHLDNEGSRKFYMLTGPHNMGRELAVVLVEWVDKAQSMSFDDPSEAKSFFNSLSSLQHPQKRTEGNQTVVSWFDRVKKWNLVATLYIHDRIGREGQLSGIENIEEATDFADLFSISWSIPFRIVEERTLESTDNQR